MLYIVCATTLFGQRPLPPGQLNGRVVDAVGAAISRAAVFVRPYSAQGSNFALVGRTDRNGDFRLTLPEGGYDVIVTSPGFQSKMQIVVARGGKPTQMEWKLAVLNCDFPGINCDTFQ
jgi:hypothetical protein